MSKFEVGDKVYLRDWDDMESQYGSFEIGGRVFLHTLCIEMDKILPICGRSWHIKEVLANHSPAFSYTNYILTDGSDYIIPEEALIDRNWRPDANEVKTKLIDADALNDDIERSLLRLKTEISRHRVIHEEKSDEEEEEE